LSEHLFGHTITAVHQTKTSLRYRINLKVTYTGRNIIISELEEQKGVSSVLSYLKQYIFFRILSSFACRSFASPNTVPA
jgi:hypothetical protein